MAWGHEQSQVAWGHEQSLVAWGHEQGLVAWEQALPPWSGEHVWWPYQRLGQVAQQSPRLLG